MPDALENAGIRGEALERFVEERIYALPGTGRHREEFSILLTGSRAIGAHSEESDVDIEVLCRESVFEPVHGASLKAGIVTSPSAFLCCVERESVSRYFDGRVSGVDFSLVSLESVERRLGEYEDVALWIYTHAKVLADPEGRFGRIVERFRDYPKDVLIRKIKYHWLAAGYWAIDVYPHHHKKQADLSAAATALLNSMNEHVRFFLSCRGQALPLCREVDVTGAVDETGKAVLPFLRGIDRIDPRRQGGLRRCLAAA